MAIAREPYEHFDKVTDDTRRAWRKAAEILKAIGDQSEGKMGDDVDMMRIMEQQKVDEEQIKLVIRELRMMADGIDRYSAFKGASQWTKNIWYAAAEMLEHRLCSIKEADFDAGGTLLFPHTKMSDYPEDIDLTFENITPLVDGKPGILSESYDVFMFGGLKDKTNNVHNDNGLPHISRDPSGQSARLIFLLRNQHQGF